MTILRLETEPLRPALVYAGQRVTYTEWWDWVDELTEEFVEGKDAGPGRFTLVCIEEPEDAAAHMLAALNCGGAAGMIDPAWPTRRWLTSVVFLAPHRRATRERKWQRNVLRKPERPAFLRTNEEAASPDNRSFCSFTFDRDAPAAAIFTSGSSGAPKAAVLSAGNILSGARAVNRILDLGARDRWLLSLSPYHVSGLSIVFRCLLASAAVAVPGEDEPLAEAIVSLQPTHVSLVATQLYRLLRDEKSTEALAKCKAVVMGGGPTPEPLVREALARGIKLVMSYGMTETAAMICCTRPGDAAERLLSSGKPLVDGTVSISAAGEILVRGDQLFLGYLQPDGSLHRPLTEEGWFRTGDLGHLDEAGYLHVTGRRDNMFISGGENIQPEEIEAALRAIAGVEEAIVVPVEDAEWGRRPVAFVRLEEGRARDPAAIETRLREILPGYKIPRAIYPWPADLVRPGLKPARRDFEGRAKELATD